MSYIKNKAYLLVKKAISNTFIENANQFIEQLNTEFDLLLKDDKLSEEVKKEIIKEKELALKSYQYKIDFLKNKH